MSRIEDTRIATRPARRGWRGRIVAFARLFAFLLVPLLLAGSCANPWARIDETPTTVALQKRLHGPGRVIHGNYCGFGTIDGTMRIFPIDRLDAICQRHDICYTQGQHHCDCDEQLRANLAEIIADPATRPEVRRKARMVRSTFALPFCRLFPEGIMPPRDRKLLDDINAGPI